MAGKKAPTASAAEAELQEAVEIYKRILDDPRAKNMPSVIMLNERLGNLPKEKRRAEIKSFIDTAKKTQEAVERLPEALQDLIPGKRTESFDIPRLENGQLKFYGTPDTGLGAASPPLHTSLGVEGDKLVMKSWVSAKDYKTFRDMQEFTGQAANNYPPNKDFEFSKIIVDKSTGEVKGYSRKDGLNQRGGMEEKVSNIGTAKAAALVDQTAAVIKELTPETPATAPKETPSRREAPRQAQ